MVWFSVQVFIVRSNDLFIYIDFSTILCLPQCNSLLNFRSLNWNLNWNHWTFLSQVTVVVKYHSSYYNITFCVYLILYENQDRDWSTPLTSLSKLSQIGCIHITTSILLTRNFRVKRDYVTLAFLGWIRRTSSKIHCR